MGQGTFVDFANNVGSPKFVLPFIYIASGAPVILAGLLLPTVQVSRIIGQIFSAPVISGARQRKLYWSIGLVCIGLSLGLVGVSAHLHENTTLIIFFGLAAVLVGVFQGLCRIAYQQLLGDLLNRENRSKVSFVHVAIGAALTIGVAWATIDLLTHENPLHGHVVLLWAGVIGCVASALVVTLIREPATERSQAIPGEKDASAGGTLRKTVGAFKDASKLGWFRRVVVAWVMMLSIEFAMPFYAIHAASLHAEEHNSLSLFVIAASLGVILSAPVWHWISKYSIKMVMVGCCLVALAAAGYAIAVTVDPSIHDRPHYAGVVFAIATATRGLTVARTLYLVQAVPGDQRPYFEAAARSVTGTIAIPLSVGLGVLAHIHSEVGSILVLGFLNALTILAVLRLRNEIDVSAERLQS